jgi:hypothetical protein
MADAWQDSDKEDARIKFENVFPRVLDAIGDKDGQTQQAPTSGVV